MAAVDKQYTDKNWKPGSGGAVMGTISEHRNSKHELRYVY